MAADEKSDDGVREGMSGAESTPGNGINASLGGFELSPQHLLDLRDPRLNAPWPIIVMNPYSFQRRREEDPNDQALWPIPEPEDLSHHIEDADLNREIENIFLSYVANTCEDDSSKRRLMRKVKLDQSAMRMLDQKYGSHMRELVYQILLAWKRLHPDAKVRDLVRVLSESKMLKSVLELKKLFSSFHWRD